MTVAEEICLACTLEGALRLIKSQLLFKKLISGAAATWLEALTINLPAHTETLSGQLLNGICTTERVSNISTSGRNTGLGRTGLGLARAEPARFYSG